MHQQPELFETASLDATQSRKERPQDVLQLQPRLPSVRRLRVTTVLAALGVLGLTATIVVWYGTLRRAAQHAAIYDPQRDRHDSRLRIPHPFSQWPTDYRFAPPAPPAPPTPSPVKPEPPPVTRESPKPSPKPVPTPPTPDPALAERLRQLRAEFQAAIDSPIRFAIEPEATKSATMPGDANDPKEPPVDADGDLAATTLAAGTVIPAALVTAINTDLPGTIIGQVSADIFDGRTGRILIVPRGARLIGQYGSQIHYGQNRVLVTWRQLTLPSGKSIALEAMPGTDLSGAAGLADRVDYHPLRLTGAVFLSTAIALGGNAARGDAGDNEVASLAAESTALQAGRIGQLVVDRELNVPPTITIRAGTPFYVLVDRDLPLPAYQDDRMASPRRSTFGGNNR